LRSPSVLCRYAKEAGFRTTLIQSLQPHYATTLDCWAERLQAKRETAIELTSQETYDMYMHYLTGCARYFRSGHLDVIQFTCCK
jgi:cyclopropane-fatty-acyl-phospholipid synthase